MYLDLGISFLDQIKKSGKKIVLAKFLKSTFTIINFTQHFSARVTLQTIKKYPLSLAEKTDVLSMLSDISFMQSYPFP